ncbi:MAG: IclR family transcriptional regulator [Actinobacteria bacterium]|nr:IclR family transcriptional regulator [Actinomycetota bacterium]
MPPPRVKVLGKAARLLDLLAERPDASAPELAQRLGEPRPTVYRLVQDLVSLGYLEQGARRGTYRLGMELFRLGSLVGLRLDVRESAAPVMNALHAATEETVYLVVRRHREAVCIDRVEGLHIRSMALHLGGSLPLHLGAAPRALLAYQTRDYWDEYLSEAPFEAMTPRSPTSKAGIVALLEEVRNLGYSVSDEDVTLGIASVGAPIFDHTGSVHAALSVGGLRAAVLGDGGQRAAKLVMEGAAQVSRKMGYLGAAGALRPSDHEEAGTG